MRKSMQYPTLALGLGIAAALLRMWQRAAYDESGLPVPFAFPSLILSAFLGICAGAFLYLALSGPKVLEDQKSVLPWGDTPAMLFTAAGVLVFVGGMVNLLHFFRAYLEYSQTLYSGYLEQQKALRAFLSSSLMTGVTALAAVPTAAALLLRARLAKEGNGDPKPFTVMMPLMFCWLWLIKDFRQHTSNPILWDYVLLLLAIIALLVSASQRAGFAFGVGKPRRSVFTSLAALTLALASLPDCGGIANVLTMLALSCAAYAELAALLDCCDYRPKRFRRGRAAADTDTTAQEDTPHE